MKKGEILGKKGRGMIMKKTILNCISVIVIFLIIYYLIYGLKKEENLQSLSLENRTKLENVTQVVSTEDKISASTKGSMSISYLGCGHIESAALNFDDTLINLNEDKFKEKFIGWNVSWFSNEKVEIEKNVDGYCYEHFVVKLAENKVMIYRKIDESNEELFKETDIAEEFLTEDDKQKLREGIEVYKIENLNSTIEDFE